MVVKSQGFAGKMLISLIILLSLCLLVDSAFAFQCPQDLANTGTIYGQITDAKTGLAIAGATVDFGAGIIALSNQTGYYIRTVPGGNSYTISVSSQGYTRATQTTGVQTNGCTQADFPLQPAIPQPQLITSDNVTFLLAGAILGGLGVFVATKRKQTTGAASK